MVAEDFEIECTLAALKLGTERREAGVIDSPRTQDKTVRTLFQLELIARLDAQCFQNSRRKGHLTFCRNFDPHFVFLIITLPRD